MKANDGRKHRKRKRFVSICLCVSNYWCVCVLYDKEMGVFCLFLFFFFFQKSPQNSCVIANDDGKYGYFRENYENLGEIGEVSDFFLCFF